DRVLERASLLEHGGHLGNGGAALADRHVDADDVLPFLVDDGVERDRGLAGLPVTDDQLTLTPANWGHGIDRLDPGLQRRVDRLPRDDAGSDLLDRGCLARLDRSLSVDRLPERVDDPADERLADRDLDDAAGGAHLVALADLLLGPEDDGADRVLFQVECHALDAALELEQLEGLGVAKAIDPCDAVTDLGDDPNVRREDGDVELLDALLDQVADLV